MIARVAGKLDVVIRGAESTVTRVDVPAEGVWLGIRFRSGTTMKGINHAGICNTSVALPITGENHFWLHGETWEVPTFENADDFVARLVRRDVLACDPIVSAVLAKEPGCDEGLRAQQRHFAKSTGLSRKAIIMIERVQLATVMLREGCSISDTIAAAGFSDQPDLTRSLKRLIDLTQGQLMSKERAVQLSFIPRPDLDDLRAASYVGL